MTRPAFRPKSGLRQHRFCFSSALKILLRCVASLTAVVTLVSFMALLRLESNPSLDSLASTTATPIHDPYLLRRNPPSFTLTNTTCNIPPGIGEEGPAGIRALYKIFRYQRDQQSSSQLVSKRKKVRLLCMVYTHSNRHDVVRSIAETYGQDCDGFLAASNVTDISIGAFNLPHDGPEASGHHREQQVQDVVRARAPHHDALLAVAAVAAGLVEAGHAAWIGRHEIVAPALHRVSTLDQYPAID